MRPAVSARRPILLGLSAALALVPIAARPSHAADLDPHATWEPLAVGVLPVTFLPPASHGASAQASREEPELAERWQGQLERALAARDAVVLHGLDPIRQRLASHPQLQRTATIARERFELGLAHWRELQLKEALADLDRARTLYLEAFEDLANPSALADVELQRGLVLRELSDPVAADLAFRALFALDPGREIQHGYYDAETERALLDAAREVRQRPNPLAALWEPERLKAAGKLVGVDLWAYGIILPAVGAAAGGTPSAPELALAILDLRLGGGTRLIQIPLGATLLAQDRLDRELSVWHTCALEARGARMPRRSKYAWDVDLGYVHSVWIRHRRTRDFLHGPGAEIGLAWRPTPGLELYARTAQVVTMVDSNSDLLDAFTVTRTTLGAGLTVESEGVQFTLRAGLDLALSLSDIHTTTDVDCKFFGAESERCGGIFRAKVPAVWFGFDFAVALRFRPARTWFVAFTAGAASYVVAPEAARELNFPLYGSLGFGLPF